VLNVGAWSGLHLVRPAVGGHRNEVWFGLQNGEPVSVRRSRRSVASLNWELELLHTLTDRGFCVPTAVASDSGALSHEGIVVQEWIDGHEPATDAEWKSVADELVRLHESCSDVEQRPGCVTVTELTLTSRSVDADMAALPIDAAACILQIFEHCRDIPVSLIHGDPGPSNVRITDDGRVAFLDWDESRHDLVWHDLSNLGVQVLEEADHMRASQLSDAWEAANAWVTEPDYAQGRYAALRDRL
jgi:Ser/Thr protein kinase RdoA (MazF antagonist)